MQSREVVHHRSRTGTAFLRWTFESAATEFRRAPRTVAARVKASGQMPGEDGKFSTVQICAALFGDLEAEKVRKLHEEADRLGLQNERLRENLILVDEMAKRLTPVLVSMRQRILSSSLPEPDVDELLDDLGKLFTDGITTPTNPAQARAGTKWPGGPPGRAKGHPGAPGGPLLQPSPS